MTTTKHQPRKPIAYSGTGSATESYFKQESNVEVLQENTATSNENWAYFKKDNTKHRVILSLMYQAQWTTKTESGKEVPDMLRLSNFLKSEKSPVQKKLIKMNDTELEKLIAALSGIVKSLYK